MLLEMARYLAPLLAWILPLHGAWAEPSTDLAMGIKLVRSGTSRNLERGAKLVHAAAMNGETRAEYLMGWLYLKGKGTTKSPERAVRWFRKAAAKGNVKSQLALGRLLGRSRKSELRTEAWKWLEAAHAQGAPSATMLLGELAKGRVGDAMMKKTEMDVAPAGGAYSRPQASTSDEAATVTEIDLGRGTPATPEEEEALRKAYEQRDQESAARNKQLAEQASAEYAKSVETKEAQSKAAQQAAEAARREAVDRAARRAAGLPELPRGQLSPHLRNKEK